MEYKVIQVKEGILGATILGESIISSKRIEDALNEHAREGWRFRFQTIERQRQWLFWSREVAVIVLEREK
jgi:hypothetical protein